MPTIGRPFASYHLWSLLAPSVGQNALPDEAGFIKHAKRTNSQKSFWLSQPTSADWLTRPKGVYEFHHHRQLLNQPDGVEKVAQF